MDRIGPVDSSAIVDALRRVGRPDASTSKGVSASQGQSSLRDVLASLVADVDVDDDAAMAGIRMAMLRAILLREWGEDAGNDPAFLGMLDSVNGAMETDPRLRALMKEAVQSLKRSRS